MTSKAKNGVQSVRRAVSILRAVATFNKNGARLSKIAKKVDLHIATVRRILMVLLNEGLVSFDSSTKLYYLGHEMFSFAYTPQDAVLRNIYRPAIEKISIETGDTVYLAIRAGSDTLCIDRSTGSSMIQIIYDIGMRIPLGIGASGQAILSVLTEDEVKSILEANARRYDEQYSVTVKKVKRLVSFARKFGFSFNEGNHQKGITGVGVPLLNRNDVPIGAITVASISDRIDSERAKAIYELIKKSIDNIPRFGGTGKNHKNGK